MNKRWIAAVLVATSFLTGGELFAGRESKISATKHNLSSSGSGTTKSTTEDQICVFCHTPHGADTSKGPAPLWNKTLANTTYTPYNSASLDAAEVQGVADTRQPLGSSKLCLSCHDGVMALGSVRVLRGQQNVVIQGGAQVTMPAGSSGATSGFTRLLGTDLTNDHPISVTYDATLATRDGELRSPTMSTGNSGQVLNRWGTVFGARQPLDSYKPLMPLEPLGAGGAGQVQCTTCHDPHIRETNPGSTGTGEGNIKFLRANRFQLAQPTSTYIAGNDIVCLACHDKGAGGNSWAYSAHANSQVATQTYSSAAATTREFPKTLDAGITSDLPVWRAACLNCHDTHTVAGARRLTREGVSGGSSATEETCYQCHSSTGIVTPLTKVPDIKTDFTTVGNKRMPIANSPEVHDIGGNFNDATFNNCTTANNQCGKDGIESRANLGLLDLSKRHAECTDCHNPHRVVKFKDFRGNPVGNITGSPDTSGTHAHTDTAMNHTNIASGVLRGAWGVEPAFSNTTFDSLPSSFTVKRGDPGTSASSAVTETFVTREYQICMKCHSNYAYTDNNGQPNSLTRPQLGGVGLTAQNASGHANFTSYTNQAKEFQAPAAHTGEPATATGSGAAATYEGTNKYNRRSWHPVTGSTGRTIALRGIKSGNPWRAPWNNQVGSNTMYCTDCHGSNVTSATSVIPNGGEDGSPWGPHGSSNNFLLKGNWDANTGNANDTDLCFKCHDPAVYRSVDKSGDGTNSKSGFSGGKADNLHGLHGDRIGKRIKCNWCHVAVPHGWKNKALLANLLDLGPEVNLPAGTAAPNGPYNNGPYYRNAYVKISSFAQSNKWSDSNCSGINWMKSNCSSPP